MAKRTIYLDEEHNAIWTKLFDSTGRNSSKWIQDKLQEEDRASIDPYLLNKKLIELVDQKSNLDYQIEEVRKRLQAVASLGLKDVKSIDFDYALVRNMSKGITETYGVEPALATQIAKAYLSLGDKRPTLQTYMKEKAKELNIEVKA